MRTDSLAQLTAIAYKKNVLARTVIYFISAVGVLSVVYLTSSFQKHRQEIQHLKESTLLSERLLARYLELDIVHLINEINALSQSVILAGYLDNNAGRKGDLLKQELLSVAQNHTSYRELQYLTTDGRELVHLVFSGDKTLSKPPSMFNDETNDPLFHAVMGLPESKAYLLPSDSRAGFSATADTSNHSFLRAGFPINHPKTGEREGVILVNYNSNSFIDRFDEAMPNHWTSPILLNDSGYRLNANTHDYFPANYPELWQKFENQNEGALDTDEGLFIFTKAQPLMVTALNGVLLGMDKQYAWLLVAHVLPEKLRFKPLKHLEVASPTLLIGLGLAWFLCWGLALSRLRRSNDSNTFLLEAPSPTETQQNTAVIQDLYANAPCGYCSLDDNGLIIQANDTFLAWLGYHREELVGRVEFTQLLSPMYAYRHRLYFLIVKQSSEIKDIEYELKRKDGSFMPVLSSSTAVTDQNGRFIMSRTVCFDYIARKKKEATLRDSEERVRLLFDSIEAGVFCLDLQGVLTFVNPATVNLLGYSSPSELIGRHILSLIPEQKGGEGRCVVEQCKIFRTIQKGVITHMDMKEFWRKDGTEICLEYRSYPIKSQGVWSGSVSTFVDVSEKREAEARLRQAATVFEATTEAIVIANADYQIVNVNKAFTDITGFQPSEVLGKSPKIFQPNCHDTNFYNQVWEEITANDHWQGEMRNMRKDGELFPVLANINRVKDNNGNTTSYIAVFSDISKLKAAEERLIQLAHHDALTGLPNRFSFNQNLEQALARAKRHDKKVALMFLDLDRFKLINDTMGHSAGDQLLLKVSSRLRGCVRTEDFVCRLGGDEFTVVLEDISNADDVTTLADKIIKTVINPLELCGREVTTSISVGISLFPDDAENPQDLTKAADTAMYQAKHNGRNSYSLYTQEMTERARSLLYLENDLRQALVRDEFELHYQPQVDLSTNAIVGVEALLRWRHPVNGMIEPDQFITIAEETGLIEPIGVWVIEEVIRQARSWRDEGIKPLRIAINLSGRQFEQENLVPSVERALRKQNLSFADVKLEMEVTESLLLSIEKSSVILNKLKAMGISIAIDDFGTGYSSLGNIQFLPIDTLKIDRMFIKGIPSDSNNNAITSAIISMGHALGLRIVAEGVETKAQVDFLREHGCHEVQGFMVCKALPNLILQQSLIDNVEYAL